MLVRPVLSDEAIAEQLSEQYALLVAEFSFLAVGDAESAHFRIKAESGAAYLLKLRPEPFPAVAATVPAYLRASGVAAIVAPVATKRDSLFVQEGGWSWLLYPFLEGRDGFVARLTRRQWTELGRNLRAVHEASLPAGLREQLPEEDYSSKDRMRVGGFCRAGDVQSTDEISARFMTLWESRRDSVTFILRQFAALICDYVVTYYRAMTDDDRVFKALADATRRLLLDRLFTRDGRTLTELESELEMTRFGVMKHLRVLEGAGLVVTRRAGRRKLHYLNPVPIKLIHDRWIDKFRERNVSALAQLKNQLEKAR